MHELLTLLASEIFECFDLVSARHRSLRVTEKKAADFVTDLDVDIETKLRQWIHRHMPMSKIVGEEHGADTLTPDDPVWYIDPIDGTSNLIDGKQEVTIHISASHHGQPILAIVGLPFLQKAYGMYNVDGVCSTFFITKPSDKVHLAPFQAPKPVVPGSHLGVEFRSTSLQEQVLCEHILESKPYELRRYNSIGYNLLECLHGQVSCFYKPFVKLWDVHAPLSLLYASQYYDATIYIEALDQSFSPFSCDPRFIDYINNAHQGSGGVGLLTVSAKSDLDFSVLVKESFLSCEPT